MKHSKKLLAALILLVILAVFAMDSRLIVRTYEIDAAEIGSPVRLALVTDLHSCRYGEGQRALIDALAAEAPDAVLLGGDIFDDVIPDEGAETFLRGIAGIFPCYYVTGNHEYWSGNDGFDAKMEILEAMGVTILSGDVVTFAVRGETIVLGGVDDPVAFSNAGNPGGFAAQLAAVREAAGDAHYTILLSHRPEYAEAYADLGFDLVLCGHAHGGQWRIPGLLNGLYAPNQGLFPAYAGGRYSLGGTTVIVSRGLARETTRIPRIFNRPELVMLELS